MGLPKTILIDMDDTIVDYDARVNELLKTIRPPNSELPDMHDLHGNLSEDLDNLRTMLWQHPGFWLEMKPLQPGAGLAVLLVEAWHRVVIVSKVRLSCPTGYTEKCQWISRYFGRYGSPPALMIISQDRDIIKGDFLIDDNVNNVNMWLFANPHGRAYIPLNPRNADYKHPRARHYLPTDSAKVIYEEITKS